MESLDRDAYMWEKYRFIKTMQIKPPDYAKTLVSN